MVLNADTYEYGRTDYKPKFTEKLREKIREKIYNGDAEYFEKTNNVSFCEPFGYYEGYHYYGCDTKIVTVSDPKTANAIFNTLEYVNKLTKIKQIKNLKYKKQQLEKAENDYAKMERQINELFVGNQDYSGFDLELSEYL